MFRQDFDKRIHAFIFGKTTLKVSFQGSVKSRTKIRKLQLNQNAASLRLDQESVTHQWNSQILQTVFLRVKGLVLKYC